MSLRPTWPTKQVLGQLEQFQGETLSQKTKLEQKIIMCMSVCLHVSVYHMCLLPMEASVGSLGVGGNVSLCVLLSHGNCFVGNT